MRFPRLPSGSPEAFFVRVLVTEGCWPWQGGVVWNGYGQFWLPDRSRVYAHRWAYEHLVGPIPAELEVDHVCHSTDSSCPGGPTCLHRRCVNPRHLEVVTTLENVHRSQGIAALNAAKTHCAHGHPFSPENTWTYLRSGRTARVCKACRAGQMARRKERSAA